MTTLSPMISVVMPTYNAEKFLEYSIQSILNQSYKNFEFIIINDGSTDNSELILKKFADLDSRISIISRENKGLVYSLNQGIDIAKGTYIARMDADDISHPSRLEYQLEYIQSNQYDVCGTFIELIIAGRLIKKTYPTTPEATRLEALFGCPIAHGSVIMTKKFAKLFQYRSEWNKAEDYDLWVRGLVSNIKIGNLGEYLYQYRLHHDQSSFTGSEEQSIKTDLIRARYWNYFERGIISDDVNYTNSILEIRSNKFEGSNYREAFTKIKMISKILKTEEELSVLKENARILAIRTAHMSPLVYFYWLQIKHPKKLYSDLTKLKLGLVILFLWAFNISPKDLIFKMLQDAHLFSKKKWLRILFFLGTQK